MPRASRRRAPSGQRRRRGVARRHPRRPRAIPVDRRRTPEGLGQAACDRRRAGVTQTLAAAHGLLSPHRARTRSDAPHDRRIVTEAPNVMWATDATQIATVQDGKVWLFGVAEHWNAELLGWHVAKRGTRFEALQAVGMAVRNQFDRVDAGAARGLALRHDHGSNFMSDAFQKQIRSWGIAPSYAFVGE
ncbi:MAG: DDE-type integrase/transposase/recombinase, partial [Roseiarcus sp.]